MTIFFLKAGETPYGAFSNFSPHPFEIDGKWWPTSEHYFHGQKFIGTPGVEEMRRSRGPGNVLRRSRKTRWPVRDDWEDVKDDVMRRAVLAKFTAHADIRALLLGTGDEEIVDRSIDDYHWGCGKDGTGENMLGRILMETREILRVEEKRLTPQDQA